MKVNIKLIIQINKSNKHRMCPMVKSRTHTRTHTSTVSPLTTCHSFSEALCHLLSGLTHKFLGQRIVGGPWGCLQIWGNSRFNFTVLF